MSELQIQYLSIERAATLEESIGWLSDYTGSNSDVVSHQIGMSNKKEDRDTTFTELLYELGVINKRRKEIIQKFKNAN